MYSRRKSVGDKLYQYSQVDTRGRLSKDKKKGSDWHGVPLPSRKAMEEGAQHGKELVGKAEPHVKNAMEEGVKHGNELVDSAKPHVEKAMKEGVRSMAMSLLKMPSRM